MKNKSIPDPPGFEDLSKSEQLRYLQALWDRISEHPGDIPIPESHLRIAERRLKDYRKNPGTARPAYDVINHLSKKSV